MQEWQRVVPRAAKHSMLIHWKVADSSSTQKALSRVVLACFHTRECPAHRDCQIASFAGRGKWYSGGRRLGRRYRCHDNLEEIVQAWQDSPQPNIGWCLICNSPIRTEERKKRVSPISVFLALTVLWAFRNFRAPSRAARSNSHGIAGRNPGKWRMGS